MAWPGPAWMLLKTIKKPWIQEVSGLTLLSLLQLQLHLHLVPRAWRERDCDGDGHDDAAADHREPAHQPLHQAEAPVQGDGGPVQVSLSSKLKLRIEIK